MLFFYYLLISFFLITGLYIYKNITISIIFKNVLYYIHYKVDDDIEKQIEYVASHGGFTIVESHVLYKCLIKLKEDANKNQRDHLHNDDTNGDIG